MKVEEYDGKQEREILLAMITSIPVLSRISVRWDGKLFASPEANRIGDWCLGHFRKYGEAPGKGIAGYYDEWGSSSPEESHAKLVGKLLASLSDEYGLEPALNAEQVVDIAARRFSKVRLERLAESIRSDIKAGKIDRAEERVNKHSRVEMGTGAGIALFNDKEALRSLFAEENTEPLISFSGPMGDFFGGTLSRNEFVVLWGAQKSGKSHWLTWLAWQAMLQRRRVAYFQVGDMSQSDIGRRFVALATRRPAKMPGRKWPVAAQIPTSIRMDGQRPLVDYDAKSYERPLSFEKAEVLIDKVMQTKVKSKRVFFNLFCFPTITIPGIKSTLENHQRIYDWSPDVIVIDYLDNVEWVDRKLDRREGTNTVWFAARNMALELHCLVISASQVKSSAFTAVWLDRYHFSEDSRKLNHTSGLMGVHSTAEEKEMGVTRLNWINKRHSAYNPQRHWFAAGSFDLANPCMVMADPIFVGRGNDEKKEK